VRALVVLATVPNLLALFTDERATGYTADAAAFAPLIPVPERSFRLPIFFLCVLSFTLLAVLTLAVLALTILALAILALATTLALPILSFAILVFVHSAFTISICFLVFLLAHSISLLMTSPHSRMV
jgi:hypothetical protein